MPANAFLNLEGDKLSTSRNWAVWLTDYIEEFPGKEDELRYVLNALAPEARDSEFTWKDYQVRVNNELLAIYGNFINRALVLTHKYYNGLVPVAADYTTEDLQVIEEMNSYPEKVSTLIEKYRFKEAQNEMMNLARLGNKYLADNEPWKLIKTDEERVKTIMKLALEISAKLSILSAPFLPHTAAKLQKMLALNNLKWCNYENELMQSTHQINEAGLLFSRVEDEVVEKQIQKLKKQKVEQHTKIDKKAMINFDDFTKLDIRIGEILSATKVPKTSKLLELKVKVGEEVRTVVSGIAEHYSPEELSGKKVSILINLEPRKIKGILSEGMILMAEDAEGKLAMISPDKNEMPSGSVVR